MKLSTSTLILQTHEILPPYPEKLRGAIASQYLENDVYHQHREQSLIYRYPLIHYLIIRNNAVITGYKEGINETIQLFKNLTSLKINNNKYSIIEKKLKLSKEEFGFHKTPKKYRFISPWLALNKNNYPTFKSSKSREKKALLERILTGNILSSAKSLDYIVPDKIITKIIWAKQVNCSLKGTKVIGFKGVFETTFSLPDLFGLGKSVSRGFGAIKKLPGG